MRREEPDTRHRLAAANRRRTTAADRARHRLFIRTMRRYGAHYRRPITNP